MSREKSRLFLVSPDYESPADKLIGASRTIFSAAGGAALSILGQFEANQAHFAQKLMRTRPLHEVSIGISAVRTGNKALHDAMGMLAAGDLLHDKEMKRDAIEKLRAGRTLRTIGYSAMKLGITSKPQVDEHVLAVEPSDDVLHQAVTLAVEHGADPTRKGFVDDQRALEFKGALEKYSDSHNIASLSILPTIK